MRESYKIILAIGIAAMYCFLCSCYTKKQAINNFCKQDTLKFETVIHDTIKTETIQTDTILSTSNTSDTITITRDKLVIKYYKKDSLVYLKGTCQGDTIYRTKKVIVNVPALVPKPSAIDALFINYKWWILFLIGLLAFFVLRKT